MNPEPKGPTITILPQAATPNAGPSVIPASMRSIQPNALSIQPAGVPAPSLAAPPPKRRVVLAAAVTASVVAVLAVVGLRALHGHKTAPTTKMRVSGAPGPRLTATGVPEHWPVGVTVPAVLDPSLDSMDPGAKEAVTNAFATWQAANLGSPAVGLSISDTPGQAAQDGVNRLLYGPITVSGFEDAVAITISYAGDDGVIVEADTIYNNAYQFTAMKTASATTPPPASCGGRYDVQNVATHEAGHFFGLGEDMTDETTTMYITSLPCQTHKRTPTSADTTALQSIYANVAPATVTSGGCGP